MLVKKNRFEWSNLTQSQKLSKKMLVKKNGFEWSNLTQPQKLTLKT